MSNFKDSPIFSTHNDYYTPKSAWINIKHLIPEDKIIYECFMLNSNQQSKKHLQEIGYNVVGDKTIDFLTNDLDKTTYDIILSNPPYERIKSFKQRKSNLKYKCIKKLLDNDKPFIIIMNSTNIFQKWFRELVEGKDIKFIFPSKKIQFDKYEEGGLIKIEQKKNSCSFNAIYVCYKILDKNEWV
tara:strand:- start:614 stop:1168 length:555 start_codon:yes stop_codon:yes gene_type:complete